MPGFSFGVSGGGGRGVSVCAQLRVCLGLWMCFGELEMFRKLGVSDTVGWAGWPEFLRGSSGPRLCGWRVGRDPRRPGRGRGSSGPALGRGEPPRVGGGAARPSHFSEVGCAEAGPGRARSPRKEGEGRREVGGGRVAAGRHGAGAPGPPPPPPSPDVSAATPAVRADAALIAAASGAGGCR